MIVNRPILPLTETSIAALYHIYRVHLQVVQWQTLLAFEKNPEDWAWTIIDGRYTPIRTATNPALTRPT